MNIQEAAKKLLAGDLVVFPTETVYGLGAVSNNDAAVKKIFEVKGRPSINPLILHIASPEQLPELVEKISFDAELLMSHFWPGPLTICFKKSARVSDLVTAGLPTVCIRNPSHPVAQELLKLVGQPIAAPSANLSGKPSTTTFSDAKQQLENKGVAFLDGGESPLGLESTVVDCSGGTVKLLRPGVISRNQIEAIIKEPIIDESESTSISSPGQLLTHYAPSGRLTVLRGKREARRAWISSELPPNIEGIALGIVGDFKGLAADMPNYVLAEREDDLQMYAKRLYQFLNWCDARGAKEIILELPSQDSPLLLALINRLEKASNGNILKV